tara:strand:- start:204 stop:551 length:348 start_codon:yes stop_codon:yes gene_type:complete
MSISITKKPTKRDYVVELGKLYNIKYSSATPVVELLVKILNETLKDNKQRDRAIESSARGWECDLNTESWKNILETKITILEHVEYRDSIGECNTYCRPLKGCKCEYCDRNKTRS